MNDGAVQNLSGLNLKHGDYGQPDFLSGCSFLQEQQTFNDAVLQNEIKQPHKRGPENTHYFFGGSCFSVGDKRAQELCGEPADIPDGKT